MHSRQGGLPAEGAKDPRRNTYLFVPHDAEGQTNQASREAVKVQAARRGHADWQRLQGMARPKPSSSEHLLISDIVVDRKRASRLPVDTNKDFARPRLPTDESSSEDAGLTPTPASREGRLDWPQRRRVSASTLRPLPLNEYSVQRTPFVRSTLSFLRSVYLPATCKRACFRGKGTDQAYLRDLYPRIMADEMLLSALVVYAYVMRDVAFSTDRRFTREAFLHWTRTITLLRTRVAQDDRSDELLWTISALVSTGNVLRRSSEASTHFDALETVAAQKTGAQELMVGTDFHQPPPTLRTAGIFGRQLSPLPMGFRHLLSSSLITPRLARLVATLLSSMGWQDGEDVDICALTIEQYGTHVAQTLIYLRDLPISEKSIIDELIAVAVLGFLIYASSSESHYFQIANGYLQCRCYSLLHRDFTRYELGVLAWAAAMLMAAFGPATIAFDLGERLMGPNETSTDPGLEEHLRKFVWTSALSRQLLQATRRPHFNEVPFVGNALKDLVQAYTSSKSLSVRSLFIKNALENNQY